MNFTTPLLQILDTYHPKSPHYLLGYLDVFLKDACVAVPEFAKYMHDHIDIIKEGKNR